jgi:hypothetical protein
MNPDDRKKLIELTDAAERRRRIKLVYNRTAQP